MSRDAVHVYPVDDLIDHDTDSDDGCICFPEVKPYERDNGSVGWLIIHHSLDGRERNEGHPDYRCQKCGQRPRPTNHPTHKWLCDCPFPEASNLIYDPK